MPGEGYHIRIPAEWACDVPLWDTSGGWKENVCGSQSLEAVEAGESFVVVCVLRDWESDSGGSVEIQLYEKRGPIQVGLPVWSRPFVERAC